MTLTRRHIAAAARLVMTNRTSIFYSLAVTVMFGSLLAYVGMVQQIFADVFHRAPLMPTMFALCAISMGAAAFFNSTIVERLGMRRISHTAILVFIGVTAVHVAIAALRLERLWTFVLLQGATMAAFSLAVSNFGAMALEPVGAIAGIGASLQGFITTSGGALVAAAIGGQFSGSTLPLAGGALGCGLASLVFVLVAERWRLFRPHYTNAGADGGGMPHVETQRSIPTGQAE